MKPQANWLVRFSLLAAVGVGGWLLWTKLQPSGLGDGFASGNGRIEATEIAVATKLAGRVVEITVDEGDFVSAGQLLARMNTDVLEAELAEATAKVRQAENAHRTALSTVTQRESEKATAEAVVAQREAEFAAADKRFTRTEGLAKQNVLTQEELDTDRAQMLSSQAGVAAAKAQVASSVAAIDSAKSQVVEAQSSVEAAKAVIKRIEADIEDSNLKAPRSGRVQYRVAEIGEVLAAGGTVLNMVDLGDVYMTFFLPTAQAGRIALGQEVRLVLDSFPAYVIPAKVSYVASVAQFTPKTVETKVEREKLMFRVKAQISPELLNQHIQLVKTGLPGMAHLRLDPAAEWPNQLQIKVPE